MKTNRSRCGFWIMALSILFLILTVNYSEGGQEDARYKMAKLGINYTEQNLRVVIKNDDTLALNLFLQAGMDPSKALVHAVGLDKKDTVKYLLSIKANPNKFSLDGDFPIHLAIGNFNPTIIILLVNSGANLELRNKHSWTPLDQLVWSWVYNLGGSERRKILRGCMLFLVKNNAKYDPDFKYLTNTGPALDEFITIRQIFEGPGDRILP